MTDADKRARKQRGRPFPKGQSGNPAGRSSGSRNKATLVALALLDGEAENLVRKAVDLALSGDSTALRLCLERLVPLKKDAPVSLKVPKIESAADLPRVTETILAAVSKGKITPSEAQALAGILETHRKVLETAEIEARVVALEEKAAVKK